MSPSLDALVNGKMKETCERRFEWDLDEHTFACFSDFAYSADYTLKDENLDLSAFKAKEHDIGPRYICDYTDEGQP